MQITLREKIFWWLCDYWWTILFAFALLLAAYFTCAYWLPIVGLENTPMAGATPEDASTTQFADPNGEYSFSHPTNWHAEDVGNQSQQWALPDGVVMSVHSEPAASGDTLESYAQEVVTRLPYDVISQSEAQIGGQPAIRQEVAYPGETTRVALGYLVLYDGNKYQIALAGLGEIPASEQDAFIQEFEKAMATFQFKK
ncbi:MAG: hypothetical protein Q8L68_02270 [Methylococcales bacterium]|nr:hypothetical protein [Methylococcales bacterium]